MAWQPDLVTDRQAREHCRLELHAAVEGGTAMLAIWSQKWAARIGELLVDEGEDFEAQVRAAEEEVETANRDCARMKEKVETAARALDAAIDKATEDNAGVSRSRCEEVHSKLVEAVAS
jgi:hypothetical protein